MATGSVEVVYRGVFQKKLAQAICRSIVFAARKQGKTGLAYSRYSDSPERNGIPAKQFAVVADNNEEMEEYLSRYEPGNSDVTIVADDTLLKGLESWAWSGVQPVHKTLRSGGTLVVASKRPADALIAGTHRRDAPYNLAIVDGVASFSGMWVYKDDHTDVRLLGALAKAAPNVVSLDSVVAVINESAGNNGKAASAKKVHDELVVTAVGSNRGADPAPDYPPLPGWREMEECLVVPAQAVRQEVPDWEGGYYRPGRNAAFRKFTTRSMRPVVNFDTCTKCSYCWLQCPDGAFDITPDAHFDPNLEACCGCGICQEVCPVAECVTMVDESAFTDNQSQWELWSKDKTTYAEWLGQKLKSKAVGSHGFHHIGQYAEEIANDQR
jgi:pyruvate ferredoxin oxidoreductase delta subunit